MPRVPARAPLIAAAALILALAPAGAHAADYAETARNIVPSGQWGSVPVPPGADEQAKMYDALTPLFDTVSASDLLTTFKSSKFGVDDAGPVTAEAVPRAGVTITRDRFNVPHIVGQSRDDVTWAMGWVLQQDRGLLLAQGRYPGRLAALEVPNISAFGLVTGLKTFTPTAEADRIITRNGLRALRSAGADGQALLHDVDVFIDGINARLKAEKSTQKPFTRADLFAVNALVGQIFGEGGGAEAGRSEFLDGLRKRVGATRAKRLFDDLSQQADADHPATLTKSFPFQRAPRTSKGNLIVDSGSLKPTRPGGAKAAQATRTAPPHASNFLMVGASRSTNGHPIFVGGPQIGYFYPGLTLEADIKGPGFEARGVYSPANPGNLLIGRGEDFVWSLTSAGSDLIDTFAETLCGGSKRKYRYRGRCRAMKRINAGTIKGSGPVRFDTTVHGPVSGYAKSDGKRIALSRKRASYGADILFQLPFRDATIGRVTSAQTFIKAFQRSPFTFNVAYADNKDIAMFSAGRLPVRHRQVDPRLPTNGNGRYEWRGFLAPSRHPQQINSPKGELVNWNNKPAPGFGAADDQWSYGSLYRSRLLEDQLARRSKHDPASVVSAMNAAATSDLRSTHLTPTLTALLAGSTPPSPRAAQILVLLEQWRVAGSSRVDRDLDGKIDAGGAPGIWDALYPRLFDAVMRPALGGQLDDFKDLVGSTNSAGSDFTGGGISYLDKDLRTLTGTKFREPFDTRFCGGGDIAKCRTAVWAAIEAAGAEEAAKQGAEPATWTTAAERISFAPGILTTSIRYTNRPSGIQQVMSFSGHR